MIVKERDKFFEELNEWNEKYDSKECMIQTPLSSPGYHTTLTDGIVHPTRESLKYAVALFATRRKRYCQRGAAIAKRVISLQDQDENSKTYGIWPWFLEEPLKDMSPPDWNWANFCSVQLLQLVIDHKSRLPENIFNLIKESIIHAIHSIIRRNVGPSYTNIAIMGIYASLIAGQEFQNKDFYSYGLTLLKKLHSHTLDNGVTEYNSPTYTMVAIRELTRLIMHLRDEKIMYEYVEKIHEEFWSHMARRFHYRSKQWSGPHSRCYHTLATSQTLSFIQIATGVKLLPESDLSISLEDFRIGIKCPHQYIEYFARPRTGEEVEVFNKKAKKPTQGTTYLTYQFSLGSINCGEMWAQRRNLLAYWGGENPSYMRLRLLHDYYDYSSALFLSAQNKGRVLGGICFATDLGDTHISLDKLKDGKISASDLRMRFEFGGANLDIKMPETFKECTPVVISDRRTYIGIKILKSVFAYESTCQSTCENSNENACKSNNENIQYKAHWEMGKAHLDVIFYHGKERMFDFSMIQQAFCGFALAIGRKKQACIDSLMSAEYNDFDCIWPEENLKLYIPQKPDTAKGIIEMHNIWNSSALW